MIKQLNLLQGVIQHPNNAIRAHCSLPVHACSCCGGQCDVRKGEGGSEEVSLDSSHAAFYLSFQWYHDCYVLKTSRQSVSHIRNFKLYPVKFLSSNKTTTVKFKTISNITLTFYCKQRKYVRNPRVSRHSHAVCSCSLCQYTPADKVTL